MIAIASKHVGGKKIRESQLFVGDVIVCWKLF